MLAAMKWNRNSIGIEIDPNYCRMAARRMLDENQNLFSSSSFECIHAPVGAGQPLVLQEKTTAYRTRPVHSKKKALK
jgi:site-specific DNA-methyltransferase (adenine-specific)